MQDLRLAFRHLLARPSFSVVAILTLALGIGANAAVFTVVNAVLLSPLPYERPAQIVILNETSPQLPNASVTRYNYDDWRARAKSFSAMGAFRPTAMTITGSGDPERVPAKMITANLLPLLGVAVEQGRGFTEAEDAAGAEGVAIVSAGLAQRRFAGTSPLNQKLLLDNRPFTIVGVMPAQFELFQPAEIYVPFGPWAATLPEDRGWHPGIFPIARLADGVSIDQARSEMDTIARSLEAEYADSNKDVRALITRAHSIEVDWPIALFALALSAVTGVIFGVGPALQATRFDVRESLNEEARGGTSSTRHRRTRSALVVTEVALALVLLVGAGLLLRSFSALTRVPPGFNPSNLLVINLPLSPRTYGDAVVRTAAVDRIVERVATLPGVERAAVTTMVPMAGAGATIHFNRAAFPPKGPADYVMAGYRAVTPGYLETIGVRLRRGRMLDARDRAGAPPVVVINESMAKQYFQGLNPIGQRMQIGTEPDPEFPDLEVVGIVGDVKQSFEAGSKSEFFVPYAQFPDPILTGMYLNVALVARTSGDPAQAAPAVRSALREIDPSQPLVNVRTMESAMATTVAQPRLQMILLLIFAAVAVTLAMIGVYGVMAYTVSQRLTEIGVRMAMGAAPSQVIAMVVRQGMALAVLGIVIGLAGAAMAARAVQSLLFVQARGFDALTFAGAAVLLLLAAMAACYVPARRAARVSPATALGR